ncbi:hypothetical protein [Paraburkholderia phosphatilytica]|uniref:hypothetical protein n=1 Tax=Paraburkholderia phosphatilytica TaxID=2282883 RepID=UPI000E4AEBDE
MSTALRGHGYTDLPIGDRAAFELVCARHGFAPAHFDVEISDDPPSGDDPAAAPSDPPSDPPYLVTVRRGGWAQSYHAGHAGRWVREFETDLNCRFFR